MNRQTTLDAITPLRSRSATTCGGPKFEQGAPQVYPTRTAPEALCLPNSCPPQTVLAGSHGTHCALYCPPATANDMQPDQFFPTPRTAHRNDGTTLTKGACPPNAVYTAATLGEPFSHLKLQVTTVFVHRFLHPLLRPLYILAKQHNCFTLLMNHGRDIRRGRR